MTVVEASVPLPDFIDRAELRVVCGDPVADREVLISCTVSTPDQQNLEVSRWPKYPRNGLPSKFLKPAAGGDVQRLTDLYLPCVAARTLQVALSSDSIDDWSKWAALVFAKERRDANPILWTLTFEGPK